MATLLIDKLLQAAIKQGVSDIHIVVGQPPVFRLHGRMRKLETKTLEAEDAVALMKSIAPERCQRELQETGSADFGRTELGECFVAEFMLSEAEVLLAMTMRSS